VGEFENLELSTETIRELSTGELERVAGGARPTIGCTADIMCEFYVTYLCPSGETWTANCNQDTFAC
jgi:hypothetical protein